MKDMLPSFALTIANALLRGFWEGVIIAGTVWLTLRALPNLGASTRYAIWFCALLVLATVPLATVLQQRTFAAVPASVGASSNGAMALVSSVSAETSNANRIARAGLESNARVREASAVSRVFTQPRLALAAALLWLLAAGARALLLARMARELAALRRDAKLWSTAYDYPVFVSDRVTVPIATGFTRPTTIFPEPLIEELSGDALETIIIHEVAHLRRYDVWTSTAARFAELTVALNPAAWFIMRRLSIEREIACDDWVVAKTGAGGAFANTLASLATRSHRTVSVAELSALGARHALVVRIEKLLDARPRRLHLSRWPLRARLFC